MIWTVTTYVGDFYTIIKVDLARVLLQYLAFSVGPLTTNNFGVLTWDSASKISLTYISRATIDTHQ